MVLLCPLLIIRIAFCFWTEQQNDPKMKFLVVLCALALVAADDVKKSEDKKITKRSHYFDHEFTTLGGLYNGAYGLSTSNYAAGVPYITGTGFTSGVGLGSAGLSGVFPGSSAIASSPAISTSTFNAAPAVSTASFNTAPVIATGGLYSGALSGGALGAGLGYASSYAYEPYYLGSKHHTTITNEVAIPVPQPVAVPVEVEKQVPVAVPHPYAVPVDKPYPVEVPKPYAVPVPVEKQVPVPVPQPYPVPYPKEVPVPVPQPYSVPVDRPVPVPVEKPYAVPVPHAVPVPVEKQVPVPVPQPYPVEVPKPYPVHHAVPVPQPVAVPVPQPVAISQQYALQPVATIAQPIATVAAAAPIATVASASPVATVASVSPVAALATSPASVTVASLPQSYATVGNTYSTSYAGLNTYPGTYANIHQASLAIPYGITRGTYGKPYGGHFLANYFNNPLVGLTKYGTGFDHIVKK